MFTRRRNEVRSAGQRSWRSSMVSSSSRRSTTRHLGVLKNALDYAHARLVRKPAALVGYGNAGAARAIEQLRLNTWNCRLRG